MSSPPPKSGSIEGIKLRLAAGEWGRNLGEEPSDADDKRTQGLNRKLLKAAMDYAMAVLADVPGFRPPVPVRWKCMLCGRDKFTAKSPHTCVNNQLRKRHLIWEPIYE